MSAFDEIFRAGRVPLYLAPMSGFTDVVFRALCKEQGADVLVSEFLQSEPLVRSRERAWRDAEFTPEQRPAGIQIFGAVPASMAEAARLLEARLRPDFIDLNFGCPARKVVEQNAGSGLLKDLPLMEKIVDFSYSFLVKNCPLHQSQLSWSMSLNFLFSLSREYFIGILSARTFTILILF